MRAWTRFCATSRKRGTSARESSASANRALVRAGRARSAGLRHARPAPRRRERDAGRDPPRTRRPTTTCWSAQQHMLDGEVDEALAAYERAVAKDEASAFLHRRVAAVLAQQNRLPEATQHARRALELEPADAETRLFLGQPLSPLARPAGRRERAARSERRADRHRRRLPALPGVHRGGSARRRDDGGAVAGGARARPSCAGALRSRNVLQRQGKVIESERDAARCAPDRSRQPARLRRSRAIDARARRPRGRDPHLP